MLSTSYLALATLCSALLVTAFPKPILNGRDGLSVSAQVDLFNSKGSLGDAIKGAMLGSIRTRCATHISQEVLNMKY